MAISQRHLPPYETTLDARPLLYGYNGENGKRGVIPVLHTKGMILIPHARKNKRIDVKPIVPSL